MSENPSPAPAPEPGPAPSKLPEWVTRLLAALAVFLSGYTSVQAPQGEKVATTVGQHEVWAREQVAVLTFRVQQLEAELATLDEEAAEDHDRVEEETTVRSRQRTSAASVDPEEAQRMINLPPLPDRSDPRVRKAAKALKF